MLVKKSPLPKGFYWVEYGVQTAGGAAFEAWIDQVPEQVQTRSTEQSGDGRIFRVFEVKTPVDYPAKSIGFWPNASKAETTLSDTVQRPDPEPAAVDTVDRLIKGGVLVGVGMLLWRLLGLFQGNRSSGHDPG